MTTKVRSLKNEHQNQSEVEGVNRHRTRNANSAEVYAKMLNITQKRNVHSMTSFPVANRQRCPRRTTHCPAQALRKHARTLSRQLHWLIKIRNCNVAFDPEIPFLGIYNTDTSVPHKLTTAWGFSVYTVFMAKDWTHWNLQNWYWWTHPQDRNRDADVENGSVDRAWKEKVLPREQHRHIYTTMCEIAS